MSKPSSFTTLVYLFFFFSIVALTAGGVFLYSQVNSLKQDPQLKQVSMGFSRSIEACDDFCKEEIKDDLKGFISDAIATISAVPKTSPQEKVVTVVSPPSEKRVAYLNLNGSFTTSSTDWVDIGSTDVLINLEGEYSEEAYVDWEASVSTVSSGSKVFVRLYDVTHTIGVASSDLSSSSTTALRVASGRLFLWRGHNTYRVQIKSLNGLAASFSGGKIKIVY